jgi:hypothetical protein
MTMAMGGIVKSCYRENLGNNSIYLTSLQRQKLNPKEIPDRIATYFHYNHLLSYFGL